MNKQLNTNQNQWNNVKENYKGTSMDNRLNSHESEWTNSIIYKPMNNNEKSIKSNQNQWRTEQRLWKEKCFLC